MRWQNDLLLFLNLVVIVMDSQSQILKELESMVTQQQMRVSVASLRIVGRTAIWFVVVVIYF